MLEWLQMGGYGVYLWPAYGVALLGLGVILGSALVAHRRAETALRSSESPKGK